MLREREDPDPASIAQLNRLREMIREGEESLDAGAGKELDVAALLARVNVRVLEGHGRESLP